MSSRQIPLTVWRRSVPAETESAFTLPGADELLSFSDLWTDAQPDEPGNPDLPSFQVLPPSADSDVETDLFHAPGLLPDASDDTISLTCPLPPVDVSEHVTLFVPPLLGKGSLSLNGNHLLSFCSFPGSISDEQLTAGKTIDLTDGLLPDQQNSLTLCFEPFRPAGICGLFSLHTCSGASIRLTAASRSRLKAACTFAVFAFESGQYTLRITTLPGKLQAAEFAFSLGGPGEQTASCDLLFPGNLPGYCRAALYRADPSADDELLCDILTFPIGPAPRTGKAILPIPAEDAVLYPLDLIRLLKETGSPAVYTTVPLSEACISALQDEQIPLCLPSDLQTQVPAALAVNPNVRFIDPPPMLSSGAASAWQLCGLLAMPRPVPADSPAAVLLQEIFGIEDFAQIDRLPLRLAELHLLHVRLHAELVRQGTGHGALCANGEWDDPQIVRILSETFKPCHLSLAPVQGAWFAGSELVFSSRAFLDVQSTDFSGGDALLAEFALLELLETAPMDSAAQSCTVLYRKTIPASQLLQKNLLLQIPLPDHAACLALCGWLKGPDRILDTTLLPLFVGSRAVLESALTQQLPFCPSDISLPD